MAALLVFMLTSLEIVVEGRAFFGFNVIQKSS